MNPNHYVFDRFDHRKAFRLQRRARSRVVATGIESATMIHTLKCYFSTEVHANSPMELNRAFSMGELHCPDSMSRLMRF